VEFEGKLFISVLKKQDNPSQKFTAEAIPVLPSFLRHPFYNYIVISFSFRRNDTSFDVNSL
jgi:hypothetical protein